MVEVIVLMGPPGSGKTAIGLELASRFNFRYTDYEAELVRRYGTRERFLRHKDEAIARVHRSILDSIDADQPPVVIETTALSERNYIELLIQGYKAFVVLLQIEVSMAMQRVESRSDGQNLSNDLETNRVTWELFVETHQARKTDLRIDTGNIAIQTAAQLIHGAVLKSK